MVILTALFVSILRKQNNNYNLSESVDGAGKVISLMGPVSIRSTGQGINYMTVEQAMAYGYIKSGDNLKGLSYINTGGRTKALQYWDNATGAYKTVQVYDNSAFSQRAAGSFNE